MEATGPNSEQVRYWNETAPPRWLRQQAVLDTMLGPLGRRAIAMAAPAGGEQIIDVGCGCGDTTIELAQAVGAGGRVTGVDVSRAMLARARERAATAGLAQVELVEADAQTRTFAATHDLVFSRFGVMFFGDPIAAFSNLRRALRSGGRLVFVCWQALRENPWMEVPLAAAASVIPLSAPPPPGAPGPLAFADADRVRGILERGGFTAVTIAPWSTTVVVSGGAGLAGAVDLLLDAGPLASALREADPAARPTVELAVRRALAPYEGADGVRLGAGVWLVTARVD